MQNKKFLNICVQMIQEGKSGVHENFSKLNQQDHQHN